MALERTTTEAIAGVEGVVDWRVIEYGGQLFFEVEPQDPSYAQGEFGAPPKLRIPIEVESEREIERAKAAVPEGLAIMMEGAEP